MPNRSSPRPPQADAPTLGVDELEALVDATREIAEVLDLEAVLQLIVDRVRALVGADYAALGIASSTGRMERFVDQRGQPRGRARRSASRRADTACWA